MTHYEVIGKFDYGVVMDKGTVKFLQYLCAIAMDVAKFNEVMNTVPECVAILLSLAVCMQMPDDEGVQVFQYVRAVMTQEVKAAQQWYMDKGMNFALFDVAKLRLSEASKLPNSEEEAQSLGGLSQIVCETH